MPSVCSRAKLKVGRRLIADSDPRTSQGYRFLTGIGSTISSASFILIQAETIPAEEEPERAEVGRGGERTRDLEPENVGVIFPRQNCTDCIK